MSDYSKISYEDDAYVRIKEACAGVAPDLLGRLDPAARMAGRQLEYLKPTAMQPTAQGLRGGAVAWVRRGSFISVLATAERVATIHIFDHPDRIAVLEDAVRGFTDQPDSDDRILVPHCADWFVREYGGEPGADTPDAGVASINMLGALLSLYADDRRDSIIESIERIAGLDVCPAMVVLLGEGASPGTLAMASGLIALAPYAEAVQ